VHSQGGSLIESLKSSALHQDLGEDDKFLWFSTTGWVMWNAQIVGLMVGSTICIYDGNPGYPDMRRLWRFTAENKLTFFGAGAAFFSNCMKAGVDPATEFDLSHLRSVGSTGSPLVVEAIGKQIVEVLEMRKVRIGAKSQKPASRRKVALT
jgi:acetoacetyl-CoA synthetase